MKKLFLSLLTVLLPMVAFADAVEIDGIYYNLIEKAKEAEVTSNPYKYSGSVDIPASISFDGVEYSVTSIGRSAFSGCSSLTSVTIPNSVTSIGYGAFSKCSSLAFATIPNSVTSIGGSAFWYCHCLTSVSIPNSVISIGESSFEGCNNLASVYISDIAAWSSIVFSDSESNPLANGGELYLNGQVIKDLFIPNGVTSIGNYAFSGCSSLTSVTIPNSVTSIGGAAFRCCSCLTSITIPNSVTSIGWAAFGGCSSLTSITIPNSVTSIKNSTFDGCSSLTSVTIPNSVKLIREYAFNSCSSLTSVSIPISVTLIDSKAFASCPELIDVFCLAEKVPSTQSDAFQDSYIKYASLHVPAASISAYSAAEPWKNFKDIVPLEEESLETLEYTSSTDRIDVFSIDGKLIGTAISPSDASDFIKQLPSGTTAIVRIGEKSVKILVK